MRFPLLDGQIDKTLHRHQQCKVCKKGFLILTFLQRLFSKNREVQIDTLNRRCRNDTIFRGGEEWQKKKKKLLFSK